MVPEPGGTLESPGKCIINTYSWVLLPEILIHHLREYRFTFLAEYLDDSLTHQDLLFWMVCMFAFFIVFMYFFSRKHSYGYWVRKGWRYIYTHRHFIHSFKVEDTAYQLFHALLCRAEMCIYFLK